MCKIIITTPMITKQIPQAMTINANDEVGLMKSSRLQISGFYSGANMISCELGMMGVHTRMDRSPYTE